MINFRDFYFTKTFLIILCAIQSHCYSQMIPQKYFVKKTIPAKESTEWYRLNNDWQNEIEASIISGEIHFSKAHYKTKRAIEYHLREGTLLAIGMGELGGALFYEPNDTNQKSLYVNGKLSVRITNELPSQLGVFFDAEGFVAKSIRGKIKLCNEIIKSIFLYNNDIYFVTSYMNITDNSGSLFKFKIQNDSCLISKVIDFDDAPVATTVYGNNIFITTYNGFQKFYNNKNEIIFTNLSWGGLLPNSIACLDEENIFVGLNGGYAKINLIKKEFEFYEYKE
jgi:hypothetical protein